MHLGQFLYASKDGRYANPIAEQLKLGTDIGVDRTPTIFTPHDTKIIGYLPPDQMVARLQSFGGVVEARWTSLHRTARIRGGNRAGGSPTEPGCSANGRRRAR